MHKRIEHELRKLNLNTIPIDLTQTAKDGGAFRCISRLIEREQNIYRKDFFYDKISETKH